MISNADFTFVEGIRVTNVARTLLDLAGVVAPVALGRAIDRAERLELFDLGPIEELLGRAGGRDGTRSLRRAIAEWRPSDSRSELEDRFQELVHRAGLRSPRVNVALEGERGTHEVDCFWPWARFVVQLDGFAFHRTRRDHQRDASTDADLELAGYRVMRLTWDDVVRHDRRTLRRVARSLDG